MKNDNNYFNMISDLVAFSHEAAVFLYDTLKSFNYETLSEKKDQVHKIEHSADIQKHEVMKKLAREFITPIDREDIMQLSEEIDNVTDLIEEVLYKLYMYNVSQIPAEAIRMAEVIVRCCGALSNMMKEFYNFRKSATINNLIIEINRLEEECDRLYMDSMRSLYKDASSSIKCTVWGDLYLSLENCCDACEHVSDVVERVIMKNS